MAIYFDNSATTALLPEVIEVINDANRTCFANPSSIHSLGLEARARLGKARQIIADSIHAQSEEIIFTSGATEANNTVFNIFNYDLIITSPSEHASVLEPAKASYKPILWLDLDKQGFVDLGQIKNLLQQNSNKKILVSIMHGNNEIGTIQDLVSIGQICSDYSNVIFHSDCVQTYGKHEIDVNKFKLDLVSVSAHKIHGPKGVGALFMRKSLQDSDWLAKEAYMLGGSQEAGLRSGTENLVGIIAFAKAVELMPGDVARQRTYQLTFDLYTKLKNMPGFVLNGSTDFSKRVLGNLNFSLLMSRLKSEELVLQLDLAGVCASSGSACSSNKQASEFQIQSSYVLRACGLTEEITDKAIRVSLSCLNTQAEIEEFIKIIVPLLAKFPVRSKV